MTDPCKRHLKRRVTAFRVVSTEDRRYFAVGEQLECVRCGDVVVRIANVKPFGRLLGKSVREALTNYGCTEQEVEAYMRQHHPEEAARERLAAAAGPTYPIPPQEGLWPFPCRENPFTDPKRSATP